MEGLGLVALVCGILGIFLWWYVSTDNESVGRQNTREEKNDVEVDEDFSNAKAFKHLDFVVIKHNDRITACSDTGQLITGSHYLYLDKSERDHHKAVCLKYVEGNIQEADASFLSAEFQQVLELFSNYDDWDVVVEFPFSPEWATIRHLSDIEITCALGGLSVHGCPFAVTKEDEAFVYAFIKCAVKHHENISRMKRIAEEKQKYLKALEEMK